MFYICSRKIIIANGGLAQLARAFDWQSRGHRFDSDILHVKGLQAIVVFFYLVCFHLLCDHSQFPGLFKIMASAFLA